MGLVQLFRDLPCPDVMARELLFSVLADFRETGHHYLLELVHAREKALYDGGTREELKALDAKIHEHAIHEQIPRRWQTRLPVQPRRIRHLRRRHPAVLGCGPDPALHS